MPIRRTRILPPLAAALLAATGLAGCTGSSVPPGAAQAEAPTEIAVQQVTALEYELGRTQARRDLPAVAAILAEDFTSWSGSARKATRADWLNYVADADVTIAEFRYAPLDIRIMGDIAVVQGANEDKIFEKGADKSGAYSWMDVLQKRNGSWVIIANETVTVPPGAKLRPGPRTVVDADGVHAPAEPDKS